MTKLPSVNGYAIITALEKIGFHQIRQKGSHVRLKHQDGRVVTIPVHAGKKVGKGLLNKILKDAELSRDELIELLD